MPVVPAFRRLRQAGLRARLCYVVKPCLKKVNTYINTYLHKNLRKQNDGMWYCQEPGNYT
jgi:hypothetical protein